MADALSCAFGPYGSTTAVKTPPSQTDKYGVTFYTKDGHTILGNILMNLPIEYSMRGDIRAITTDTVKKVGDGTTAAVILSYMIFEEMVKQSENGVPETLLVRDLKKTTEMVVEEIKKHGRECTLMDIFEICMISTNGNYEVSKAIYEIYKKYGMEVIIDVGISNTDKHILKEFDGFTIEKGYYSESFINRPSDNTCVIANPEIYVFEDPVDTPEIKALFDKIVVDNIITPLYTITEQRNGKNINVRKLVPTVIFSSAYGHDMKSTADDMMARFFAQPADMRPPFLSVTNIHDATILADLCTLTGAKLIKKYHSEEMQKKDQEEGLAPTIENIHQFSGKAEEIIASSTLTKIIGPWKMYVRNPDGSARKDENGPVFSEEYKNLISFCENHIQNLEKDKKELTDIYLTKRRLSRLKGNMVEYQVGGISIADRDSTRDFVEDAVLNCRSAAKDGVGCGATFEALRALKIIKDNTPGIPENGYNMIKTLYSVYYNLAVKLYASALDGNENEASVLVAGSLEHGRPANIANVEIECDAEGNHKFTKEVLEKLFDPKRPVLSSIMSDQVVLSAISKIISISFSTNQFLLTHTDENYYGDNKWTVAKR